MVRIRAADLSDAAAIADIQVETWRDTYAGLIPDRSLLGLSRTSHTESWRRVLRDPRDGTITRVAEGADSCVVGFANAGCSRPTNLPYDGEVYTLYVLPDHQGAGHGQRLLGAMFSALRAAGCRSALVWVLAGNPARFFYEAMGGILVATREELFHGVVLDECAYGWPDLRHHVEARTQASDSSG